MYGMLINLVMYEVSASASCGYVSSVRHFSCALR